MPSPVKQLYTPEEYLKRERAAEYKSEYFAGEIIAMAGAKRKQNLISGNITTSLGLNCAMLPAKFMQMT